ncbi:MAG: choice-of-anchor L domain-containing protein [Bacteroidota bacterium]
MKTRITLLIAFVISINLHAQYISADHQSYSPQELIEDVLFSSDCVENINIISSVSGDFADGMLSYGFFDSNNSGFPFESGIAMSTGRLNNIEGPNNNLSDDDAPGWNGDNDLEDILGINNTINATILEFSFTPKASQLSFQYIFASEEYQENNSNTCIYSDVFAFLIRPVGGEYENIAVVPNTNTPVQVTTVRPEIPGGCPALNEQWFGQFNGNNSPNNFNGETTVLVAEANVNPNQAYEVKLVIADETNYRYDSAVFLEAGSFDIGVNLGIDRVGFNAICEGEEELLSIDEPNATEINWFFNNQLIVSDVDELLVSEAELGAGTYGVEIVLADGCTATDEIEVAFQGIADLDVLSLTTCQSNPDEAATFNLTNVEDEIQAFDESFTIVDFYLTEQEAESQENEIATPTNFVPMQDEQDVYVLVENESGCTSIAPIVLLTNNETYEALSFEECIDDNVEEFTYNVNQLSNQIINEFGFGPVNVIFYPSENDAYNNVNQVVADNFFIDANDFPTTYYAVIEEPGECLGVLPIQFEEVDRPELSSTPTEFTLCANDSDDSAILDSGITSNFEAYEFVWSTGETTPSIEVDSPGNYQVEVFLSDSQNAEDCSVTKEFEVNESGFSNLSYEIIGEPGNQQQVIINVIGDGDYVYSLNSTSGFQESNVFPITQANNIAYVMDLGGCGIQAIRFTTLQFPAFFTPNNDGINDTWRPEGINLSNPSVEVIYIFDRFGKMLVEFGPGSSGWDGTYKGKMALPDDYWYKVVFKDGSTVKGNLTLKR